MQVHIEQVLQRESGLLNTPNKQGGKQGMKNEQQKRHSKQARRKTGREKMNRKEEDKIGE